MKVVRIVTYEGPQAWVETCLVRALNVGTHTFGKGTVVVQQLSDQEVATADALIEQAKAEKVVALKAVPRAH